MSGNAEKCINIIMQINTPRFFRHIRGFYCFVFLAFKFSETKLQSNIEFLPVKYVFLNCFNNLLTKSPLTGVKLLILLPKLLQTKP